MIAALKRLVGFALLATLLACSQKSPGILSEISGVWRSNDSTLVTFIYEDHKMRMLIGDDAMPVTLGTIDDSNKTVNLNLTLANGKPGVWTVRQLWNASKTSFNLQITLDDGVQDQLAFIRKISTDDLNKIANAEARSRASSAGSIAAAAPAAQAPAAQPKATPLASPAPPVAVSAAPAVPVVAQAVAPVALAEAPTAFAPSFDCNKASTGPERLICSSRELAEADVKLSQAYKAAANGSADKEGLRIAQATWRKDERDACSDSGCMLAAYQRRLTQLKQ